MARGFDANTMDAGAWSSKARLNAAYNLATHGLNLLGPFLLPEPSDEVELYVLHVLAHEMGHGIDENSQSHACKEFLIPKVDAEKIATLKNCSSSTKYGEDFADAIANESIGIHLTDHLNEQSSASKEIFVNGLLSGICSPVYSVGDSHSTQRVRGERLLSQPLINKMINRMGINLSENKT